MKSEWKVSSNFIGDGKMYIALRVLDTSKPTHGGNVEYSGGYNKDKDEVKAIVDKLNEEVMADEQTGQSI